MIDVAQRAHHARRWPPAEPDAKREPAIGGFVEARRHLAPQLTDAEPQPILELPALDVCPRLVTGDHLDREESLTNSCDDDPPYRPTSASASTAAARTARSLSRSRTRLMASSGKISIST